MFESADDRSAGASAGSAVPAVATSSADSLPDAARVVVELEVVTRRLTALVGLAAGAAGWDGSSRARVLGLLDRLPGLTAGVRHPVLLAAQAQAAAVGNEREFVDTRARLTGTTRFQAEREVQAAQALEILDAVRDAVVENVMPVGHVQVLARTLHGSDQRVTALLSDAGTQAELVELSRGTDSREFARSVAALVAAHDPDRLDDERASAHRARFLTLSHTPDGTVLKGRLDPLAGQALARALDSTGQRADEDRTDEQARADALSALARHALTGGLRPVGPDTEADADLDSDADAGAAWRGGAAASGSAVGGLPDGAITAPSAQVCLLVPAETWHDVRRLAQQRSQGRQRSQAQQSSQDEQRRSPTGSDTSSPVQPLVPPAVPPAVSDDGTVLSRSELATALCDCTVTRVVMTSAGLPLDVGRTRRMFTPAQRIAVIARDRQCAWNGCSTVPRYCEVHHARWWHRHTGPTDLDNAVLLCSHHHHQVHLHDLTIQRLPANDGASSLLRATRYVFQDRAGRIRNGPEVDRGGTRDGRAATSTTDAREAPRTRELAEPHRHPPTSCHPPSAEPGAPPHSGGATRSRRSARGAVTAQ